MKHRARALRKNMPDAERMLWGHLRNRQLSGYKFRRQHPIGSFVVDFVCLEKNLIIEVDGGQHAKDFRRDFKRSDYLNEKGYRILRFWNNEVLQESESVLNVTLDFLSEGTPSPRPSPPQAWEGED